ncbi:hypothetical protein Fmac_028759 [Flemingia macrophylla]|uniref:Uncharacterized protein n=1 Tax=Flemingia macrophylla TaxID=520843 RepID=A0ABD1L9W3_9FABA
MMWLQIHLLKLDALVNLVSQLAASQKPACVARVCNIHFSNDHHTSVCPSWWQSGVDEHTEADFSARNDVIVIRGVHDVATDTSVETRKLEGKLDALVNFVIQLAANQKPASVARVCSIRSSNDHRNSFRGRNDVIVIKVVHDVGTAKSIETRKLEGKLDALVNLVTQLAMNQKPVSVARVCGIRSSNDDHTSVCPSSQQSGVDEHPEAYLFSVRNDVIVIKGVHDVATDTSVETRKLEGKLDALVNLVTQLAANQKPASAAKVSSIRSSNDHHTSVCPSSQQSGMDEHPEAYAANTYSRPP